MGKMLLVVGAVFVTVGLLGQANKVNVFNSDPFAGYDWAFDQVYTGSEFIPKTGILGFYSDNKFSLAIYTPQGFDEKELERKGTYSFNRTIQSNAIIFESDHGKQLFRYSINDRQLILHEFMEDSFGD